LAPFGPALARGNQPRGSGLERGRDCQEIYLAWILVKRPSIMRPVSVDLEGEIARSLHVAQLTPEALSGWVPASRFPT